MGVSDFDIISEDVVEADFQAWYASQFGLSLLHSVYVILAGECEVTQFVEVFVVARSYHTAFVK